MLPQNIFFSSRRRHTRWNCDWSSDVCSSDLRARDEEDQDRDDREGGAGPGASVAGAERSVELPGEGGRIGLPPPGDRKSTRLNSSHSSISYAVFCLKKKKKNRQQTRQTTEIT